MTSTLSYDPVREGDFFAGCYLKLSITRFTAAGSNALLIGGP